MTKQKYIIVVLSIFAIFMAPLAYANQLSWDRENKGYYNIYRFEWADFSGNRQKLAFKVESSTTDRAKETDKSFLLSEALAIKYEKAQREASIRSGSGVSIRPYQMRSGNVGYRYTGDPARAKVIVESSSRDIHIAIGILCAYAKIVV